VVYRVDTVTGEETVAAGTGVAGFSGDGGPATQAELHSPGGLGVNATGELFVGDTRNDRVRIVAANGTITTIAGTGPHEEGAIRPSGDGGPATEARLSLPTAVAVEAAARCTSPTAGSTGSRPSGTPSDRRGAELKRLGEKLSQAAVRADRYRLEQDDAKSDRNATRPESPT
jgi:hypothetical protein